MLSTTFSVLSITRFKRRQDEAKAYYEPEAAAANPAIAHAALRGRAEILFAPANFRIIVKLCTKNHTAHFVLYDYIKYLGVRSVPWVRRGRGGTY